jgi:hypothetical protein
MGSNDGLRMGVYGMWAALPLVFLLADDLYERAASARLRSVLAVKPLVMGLILVAALFFQATNVVRDNPNRLALTAEFRAPGLHHVYSNPQRVQVVDEALTEIARLTQKGDPVLLLDGIPMFYYLTETRPVLGHAWPGTTALPEMQRWYEQAVKDNRFPRLFVCVRKDTTDRYWPVGEGVTYQYGAEGIEYFKSKYVGELGYRKVWENALCVVYARPEDVRVPAKLDDP